MVHLRRMRRISLIVMGISIYPALIFTDLIASEANKAKETFAFAQVRDGSSVTAEINLNGAWQFKATDEEQWMNGIVPSTIWTDLLRVGRIEDPFYRDNELKVQWIEKKEWEYRRIFQVSENFLRHEKIFLDCRGLDTIAEIYLNDQLVAKTQNMFIEYEFSVKSVLRVGENSLLIIFRSILEWNKEKSASEPKVVWEMEKGNVFYARKEGSDFGWDWGLRLLSCGIWRPIRLAAYDTGRITGLLVRQNLNNPKKAVLDITAELEQFNDKKLNLEIQVLLENRVIARTNEWVTSNKWNKQIVIINPKLWWPNGWGNQPLYTIHAILKKGDTVIQSRKMRIGLRTIELVREKDLRGETFGFKVNGNLIFCKGANWVPADALPDRLTEDQYKHLLRSCVEANMNMIRLWGGGLYEPEIFYDYCDEHGIMIWHDFMFAVGPFGEDSSFLENIRQEIAHVVKRLRHHPSIALWCGNNEVESNMPAWTKQVRTVTWKDYDIVFNQTIPNTVALHDPDRPYWPSSPHHPLDREKKNPDAETASGDVHIWDVWHGDQPFSWYAKNTDFRFVSEFGFQSLPTMETIRSFTLPEDRYFISHIIDQHNMGGKKSRGTENIANVRIARYMAELFRMPVSFDNWVYVSQVMQGEGIRIGVEAYRRNFPNTTGALYWQLNDNWPVISWSSIDYYGRWKALHYFARRFFNSVLVSGSITGTQVHMWGVNDLLNDIPATLQWTLARFDGSEVMHGEQQVVLPANSSSMIAELNFDKQVGENPDYSTYRKDSYQNRRQLYLAYRLVLGEEIVSTNVTFFVPQKYLALVDPGLQYYIKKEHDQLIVNLSAERFAAYVELGLKGSYARFSDNYFYLLPGEMKKIIVLESEASDEEFIKQFYAKSLIDSYK